jgi:hypothetical protein
MSESKKDAEKQAADTMAGDLIATLVKELRVLPDIWSKIGPDEQADIIERIRKRVGDDIRAAVHTIASENRVAVLGELKKVTFSDKTEAVFALGKRDPAAMDLCHAQGQACVIVVADPSKYTGGLPEKDERQMSLLEAGNDEAASLIEQARRRSQTPKADDTAPEA